MNIELIVESVAIDTLVKPIRHKQIKEVLSMEENLCEAIALKILQEADGEEASRYQKVVNAIKEVLASVWKSIVDFYIKYGDVPAKLYNNSRKEIEIGYENIKDNENTLGIKKYNFKSGLADKIYNICEDAIVKVSAHEKALSEEQIKKAKHIVRSKLSMEGISDDNILEPSEISKYNGIKLSDILETLKESANDRRCMEKAYSHLRTIRFSISKNGNSNINFEFVKFKNMLTISADILNKYSKQQLAKTRDMVKLAKLCINNSK